MRKIVLDTNSTFTRFLKGYDWSKEDLMLLNEEKVEYKRTTTKT